MIEHVIKKQTEWLVDRQVSFDEEHRNAGNILFVDDGAPLTMYHRVHATDCRLRALNLAEVYGFENTWLRRQHRRIEAATRRWDDLAVSAMHCISVQRHVVDVEADAPHVLVAQNAL